MLLFCLEDQVTGEIKNLATPNGTTEAEVRARYGGIWLDASRTSCSAPCQIGPLRKPAPPEPVSLAAARQAARQQAAKSRRMAARLSGQRVA